MELNPAKVHEFIGETKARLDGFDREFQQLRRELVACEARMKAAITAMNNRSNAKSVGIGAGGGTVAFALLKLAEKLIFGG
ncbi:hypothetical protein LCGC14_2302200 [marine sediment metagenome]|uniref:Uncharacterized protein n=1 Tax=marine sediment metagenome TaxID=412755 RepID=A0A0F9F0L6_9ZZZZ